MSNPITVLIIDDNPFDRELVRESLTFDATGFKLIEAATRPELEKILASSAIDIVLTDYNILEYDGLEIVDFIIAKYPHLPVVMLTGTGSEEIAVKALKSGVSDYVVKKSSHIKRLPSSINKALALKKLSQEKEEAINNERKAKNNWERTFNSISDPIMILNPDLTIKQCNTGAEKLSDSPEKIVGKHCYELFAESDQPCPYCRIEKGATSKASQPFEINHPGKKRTFQVTLFPVLDDEKKLTEIIHHAKDVTARKNLAEQLYQSQKMESIGTLAGGIAHDFNNILTVINMYSEISMMELEKESELWNSMNEIHKAGERAANLTRQLLAFSRKQMIMPRPVNINQLLDDMKKMLGRLISEDIKLKFNLEEGVDKIYADPGQLDQIIMNLTVNARDAVNQAPQKGEKIIRISTSQVFLEKNYAAEHYDSSHGWYLQLEIEDNGCGMTQESQKHIFEPFYTTKEVGRGTGLGLATVYGIIKQNQGNIDVYSEPERGTTFKIYWPIIKEGRDETEAEVETTAKGGNEVILVAEDSEQLREISCKRLRDAGYTVIEASNGKEALEKLENYPGRIDLLFTDVIMPVMGGRDLSEQVKAIYPNIPILFASGYSDNYIRQGLLTSKKDTFINKPYLTNDILINIRKLLDT